MDAHKSKLQCITIYYKECIQYNCTVKNYKLYVQCKCTNKEVTENADKNIEYSVRYSAE